MRGHCGEDSQRLRITFPVLSRSCRGLTQYFNIAIMILCVFESSLSVISALVPVYSCIEVRWIYERSSSGYYFTIYYIVFSILHTVPITQIRTPCSAANTHQLELHGTPPA